MISHQLKPGPWLAIHRELDVEPPEFDDTPLGTFIERHAEAFPDNGALRYFERDISYRELNELSNYLANALTTLGVGPGDIVGLHMTNVPQFVIAVVAVCKIGATTTTVSPLLAPAEVANQLEDAAVKVLISLDSVAKSTLEILDIRGSLPGCLKAVIVTGENELRQPSGLTLPKLTSVACMPYLEVTADSRPEYRQRELSPDQVYLILYTGGTTGKPKGAMLTLRGVMYHSSLFQIYAPWDEGNETVACANPLFHAGGLALVIAALRYGARYLLIPNARDIGHFCQQMAKFPPTRLAGVPTLYQMLADHPLRSEIDFSGVKFAVTGAAPITGGDRQRIERMLCGAVLSDGFGMTESGPTILVNPPGRCKPESVGLPLPAVDVRIVDTETGKRELPYGEAGEIIASCQSLMKGYLGRPDESANSLRDWQGKTWMYTGDIGVMDEEGYVYLKDRAKDMINVSGFKVFSVEVEDKLSALDFIACSALVGSPDPNRPGNEIVNLYVELAPEANLLDPEKIREDILDFCRAEMAPYKVPKLIHLVDAIPLTAIGKIDKKMLRDQANSWTNLSATE